MRDWKVQFVRSDGAATVLTDVLSRKVVFPIVVTGALLLVFGTGVGLWIGFSQRAQQRQAMQGELDQLRAEVAGVHQLEARLAEIEYGYSRFRALLLSTDLHDSAALGDALGEPALVAPEGSGDAATAEVEPVWPLARRGFITRGFAPPDTDAAGRHTGIDIVVPTGSYVRSILPGRVLEVGEEDDYGRFVRIGHGDGLESLYAHNSWVFPAAGDSVERLDVLALTGSTGASTAPHLHFELTRHNLLVDPLEFVSAAGFLVGDAPPGNN